MQQMKRLSTVFKELQVGSVDLLKIDVEGAECDVIEGVDIDDWPKISQLVAEVHDIDGRLQRFTRLLELQGYVVHTETNVPGMEGLDAPNRLVYARRPNLHYYDS